MDVSKGDKMVTLYLSEQDTCVKRRNDCLIVHGTDKRTELPLAKLSQVVVSGNVTLTAPVVSSLLEAGIAICYLSAQGQFLGRLVPPWTGDVMVRQKQHRAHDDPRRSMQVAQACVQGKLQNMCSMLILWQQAKCVAEAVEATRAIQTMLQALEEGKESETVMSINATASVVYRQAFGKLLNDAVTGVWHSDRVAAESIKMLYNLSNVLLIQQVTTAIQLAGLDPDIGFLHRMSYRYPALSLDLMEEFRPLIADEVLLDVLNRRVIGEQEVQEQRGVVQLNPMARKTCFVSFEQCLKKQVQHPHFGYWTSYRRCIEVQANLLSKYLTEETPVYRPFCIEKQSAGKEREATKRTHE